MPARMIKMKPYIKEKNVSMAFLSCQSGDLVISPGSCSWMVAMEMNPKKIPAMNSRTGSI